MGLDYMYAGKACAREFRMWGLLCLFPCGENVTGAEAYTCIPRFILIHPTVWPQYTNVTDRTGERSDSIVRTVLGRTVCKTLRPIPTDRCLSASCPVLSVTLVYCGQTVEWIKMKLGTQVGFGPGHIVTWGPRFLSPKGVQRPPPNFRPISVVAKWLDGSRCHLVGRLASTQATLC